MSTYYRIAGARYWSVDDASFVSEKDATGDVIFLTDNGGFLGEEALADLLYSYGYSLGELADKSELAIKTELARLDDEYLTRRTLLDLYNDNDVAKARAMEHEVKAAPLREKLRALAKNGAE